MFMPITTEHQYLTKIIITARVVWLVNLVHDKHDMLIQNITNHNIFAQ